MAAYRRKLKKGIRWRFVGSYLGQRYHSKAIYLTKQEALKAERKQIERIDSEQRRGRVEITIKELMDEKLDQIKLNQSKPHYQEARRYYKMLLKETGDCEIGKVKKAHIVKLLNGFSAELKSRKKGNWNANSMLRILKALFYYGINTYDLDIKNPCAGIPFFPIDRELKYIPTNKEIESALLDCDDEERLLIAFVMETGCRINEALRFSDKDVNSEIVLYTRKAKNSNLTSRKIPKPLCLPEFKGRLFKRWTQYPRFLENLKWGFHSLRHRFAAYHHSKGMPLYILMERLGHSQLLTSQIYLKSLPSLCLD